MDRSFLLFLIPPVSATGPWVLHKCSLCTVNILIRELIVLLWNLSKITVHLPSSFGLVLHEILPVYDDKIHNAAVTNVTTEYKGIATMSNLSESWMTVAILDNSSYNIPGPLHSLTQLLFNASKLSVLSTAWLWETIAVPAFLKHVAEG